MSDIRSGIRGTFAGVVIALWGFIILGMEPSPVWAETVELVTYYPSSSDGDFDRLHARRATIGDPYAPAALPDANVPNDTLLVSGNVGIGIADPAGWAPTQRLEVVGNVWSNSPGAALFMADRGANTDFSGLQLLTAGTTQWTIGSRNDGTNNLHFFDDAISNRTLLFLEQGTGRVGIGTTTPAGPLHVRGQDDQASVVAFMPGADTGAAGTPSVNVGIGTTAPAGRLHIFDNTGAATPDLILEKVDNALSPVFQMRRARRTVAGTPQGIQAGDLLGSVSFAGYDTSAYRPAAQVVGQAGGTGAWSTSSTPALLTFSTTPNGTVGSVERMRITEAGNVGIGTTTPASSALLDLGSTTQGFLPPRMTTAQRDAISSPALGLLIYNTTTSQYNYYTGSAWTVISAGGGPQFITPVTVSTSPSTSWTTYDASSSLPAGATAVILQAAVNAATENVCLIQIRRDSSSSAYLLIREGTGDDDPDMGGSQGTFPVSATRTFQYRRQGGGNATIELIGYFQ